MHPSSWTKWPLRLVYTSANDRSHNRPHLACCSSISCLGAGARTHTSMHARNHEPMHAHRNTNRRMHVHTHRPLCYVLGTLTKSACREQCIACARMHGTTAGAYNFQSWSGWCRCYSKTQHSHIRLTWRNHDWIYCPLVFGSRGN